MDPILINLGQNMMKNYLKNDEIKVLQYKLMVKLEELLIKYMT